MAVTNSKDIKEKAKMEKIINIPQDVTENLQKLQNEVESRKALMMSMMDTGVPIVTQSFADYHAKYQECFQKYSEAKGAFEKEYVYTAVERPVQWNLDFATSECTIAY